MKVLDAVTQDKLDDILHRIRIANPAQTLERAISHIGKSPSYNTGDAIHILGLAIVAVRTRKEAA